MNGETFSEGQSAGGAVGDRGANNQVSGTFNFKQINLGHIILASLGGFYGFTEHNFNDSRSNVLEGRLGDIHAQLASLQTKTDQISTVQIQLASLQAKVDQMSLDNTRREDQNERENRRP